MAAPTEPTNYEKVIRSVEYNLKQISWANGYYTEKFVVDETDDPGKFLTPGGPDWNRYHRFVQVHPGNDEVINLVGNHSDYDHTYMMLLLAELTNADQSSGLRLKDIRSRMIWDIKRALRQDYNLNGAAAALGYSVNPSNGQRLSCVYNRVEQVIGSASGDEYLNFPFVRCAIICKFRDKENIQAGIQAG